MCRLVSAILALGVWLAGAASEAPPADIVPHAGLSAAEAVRATTLPDGFAMHVFAAEPEVRQPIAFALDHRGRVWVAEGFCYPRRRDEGKGIDRILVFEDTNGDHQFDRRTVFLEGLNLVSGLEVGHGGVWIGAAPYLLFVPVEDWDTPKPGGEPRVLLDGWDYRADTHETLNTFAWGPDGWLYGCHGVFCPSHVGKPGAPESERQWVDAAVWRYHPTQHRFEVFAEGTSNPWGVDFDERGQCWIEACVIPHLWHMIQGGRYQRQGGLHYCISADETARNEAHREARSRKPVFPHVYADLQTTGDHVHWAGGLGPHAANARSDAVGGGHAHAGLMVYLGDSWPERYRGCLFMGNIHGQRLNMDIAERRGSGYVGRHGADFLNFNDTWSQTLNQLYDPDGSVFIIDWYDKNQCHHNDPEGHDRGNGRIYKVVYGNTPVTSVDLRRLGDLELVDLLAHRNDWYPRHAQRLLHERAHAGRLSDEARRRLVQWLETPGSAGPTERNRALASEPVQLRVLWALHATGGLTEELGLRLLNRAEEYVCAWTIQLLCEDRQPSAAVREAFERMARTHSSAVVRLYLMSALQRLALDQRWEIYSNLIRRAEDVADPNLPLMAWYAGEPLVAAAPARALGLARETEWPRLLEFTTRRIALLGTGDARDLLARVLADEPDPDKQLAMLEGLTAALEGERSVRMPEGWSQVEAMAEDAPAAVRGRILALSLKFGSEAARDELRRVVRTVSEGTGLRREALAALVGIRDPGLPGILQELLEDSAMRRDALRGLAAYDDPGAPAAIVQVYGSLTGAEKREALNALTGRPAYARELLAAIGAGQIPRADLTADRLRQLRTFNDPEIDRGLAAVWGAVRESGADAAREIERLRSLYWAGGSQPGEASRGRAVYTRNCQQCHVLFGVGRQVGPDLTGSNRGDLDYLLQAIVDPNAVIPNEYRASNLETADGRVLTGILREQDERAVTLLTADETAIIPREEIVELQESSLSMMPEGLLDHMPEQEFRDLIYYLTRPGQAPLLATPDTLGPIFNGRDLAGWFGDPKVWRAQPGQIVGQGDGLSSADKVLVHDVLFSDFRLICQVRLGSGSGGIQFRSRPQGEADLYGYQLGLGAGHWGRLEETSGRGTLQEGRDRDAAEAGAWVQCEIVAVGDRVLAAIDHRQVVDLSDPRGAPAGVLGLRLGGGDAGEISFRDFQVELDPVPELVTVRQAVARQ
jgi:putative membrane-bound dehydrogenase-like protein